MSLLPAASAALGQRSRTTPARALALSTKTTSRTMATADSELTPASQPDTHLPPSRTSPFCRDCLTNQTLVLNMLANYLPDEDVGHRPLLQTDSRIRPMPTCLRSCRRTGRRCTLVTRPCALRASLRWMRRWSAPIGKRRLKRSAMLFVRERRASSCGAGWRRAVLRCSLSRREESYTGPARLCLSHYKLFVSRRTV